MSQQASFNVTVQGREAVRLLEHLINPALKDYGCVVEWPGYPASHQITVHIDSDDLDAITGESNGQH